LLLRSDALQLLLDLFTEYPIVGIDEGLVRLLPFLDFSGPALR
jgi:hypothetical protein